MVENNKRIRAVMIASGSRKRVRRPKRCSRNRRAVHHPSRRWARPPRRHASSACCRRFRRQYPSCRISRKQQSPLSVGGRDPTLATCPHPGVDGVWYDDRSSGLGLWGRCCRARAHSALPLTGSPARFPFPKRIHVFRDGGPTCRGRARGTDGLCDSLRWGSRIRTSSPGPREAVVPSRATWIPGHWASPQPPIPAEHRTQIASGKRCRRIAGAHILAADADRPVINPAGGIWDSRERGARSTPPRGRIHRRRRCRRRVRATGAPFRRSDGEFRGRIGGMRDAC